jgi:hypothetical protein
MEAVGAWDFFQYTIVTGWCEIRALLKWFIHSTEDAQIWEGVHLGI